MATCGNVTGAFWWHKPRWENARLQELDVRWVKARQQAKVTISAAGNKQPVLSDTSLRGDV